MVRAICGFSSKGVLLLRIALVSLLVGPVPTSSSFAADAATSVVVQLREVDLDFPVEATVEAVRQATVAAQIAGRVVEIRVDAGQRVSKGQLLMRLDAREAAGANARRLHRAARPTIRAAGAARRGMPWRLAMLSGTSLKE